MPRSSPFASATDVSELPAMLRPGMRVLVGSATAAPLPFLEALAKVPARAAGVTFVGSWVPGFDRFDPCALHPESRAEGLFPPHSQIGVADGRFRVLPLSYFGMAQHLRENPVDLAILQSGPARADGTHPMTNADFADVVAESGATIILLVNPAYENGAQAWAFAAQRPSLVIGCSFEETPLHPTRADPVAQAISRHVRDLVRDGDTLQIGIGSIQSAILSELHGHRDIGVHSGLINDAIVDLIRSGVINGARKSIDRGQHVATAAFGSGEMYRSLGDLGVVSRPATYTHSLRTLARLDGFTAINSALEIDLLGQTNATHLGGRQVSAAGGYLDFVRGALAADGGRSIVALPSRSRGKSRIVDRLDGTFPVTATWQDADIVVSEYGVARLRGASAAERADALIAIAAPEDRETLLRSSRDLLKDAPIDN